MLSSDSKPSPKEPLYQRIYSDLKLRIDGGEWVNGSILPTENELCETYQVSRGTVRQVLAEMENEGLVKKVADKSDKNVYRSLAGKLNF